MHSKVKYDIDKTDYTPAKKGAIIMKISNISSHLFGNILSTNFCLADEEGI